MLPKGNFKTDFLKYDTEEEDKLSDINIVGLTVWQSKIKTYSTNILNIKPFICYPATDVDFNRFVWPFLRVPSLMIEK